MDKLKLNSWLDTTITSGIGTVSVSLSRKKKEPKTRPAPARISVDPFPLLLLFFQLQNLLLVHNGELAERNFLRTTTSRTGHVQWAVSPTLRELILCIYGSRKFSLISFERKYRVVGGRIEKENEFGIWTGPGFTQDLFPLCLFLRCCCRNGLWIGTGTFWTIIYTTHHYITTRPVDHQLLHAMHARNSPGTYKM